MLAPGPEPRNAGSEAIRRDAAVARPPGLYVRNARRSAATASSTAVRAPFE